MVDPPDRLSRINFIVSSRFLKSATESILPSQSAKLCPKCPPIIDTRFIRMLALLVLPSSSSGATSGKSIVSSIIRKWTRYCDN
jgi:hypothetical protein